MNAIHQRKPFNHIMLINEEISFRLFFFLFFHKTHLWSCIRPMDFVNEMIKLMVIALCLLTKWVKLCSEKSVKKRQKYHIESFIWLFIRFWIYFGLSYTQGRRKVLKCKWVNSSEVFLHKNAFFNLSKFRLFHFSYN